MKSVARVELKPGMSVAEDVLDYNGNVIVKKETELTQALIDRLARHSIMVVPIHEKIDFATTHFEKVRYSDGFQKFDAVYEHNFPLYKTTLMDFVQYQQTFNVDGVRTTIGMCG